MRTARAWFGVACMLGIAVNAMALPAHFEDPLQQPAQITPISLQSPVLAVAQAGAGFVAVGQRGHILRKASPTATWVQVAAPVSIDLVAVSFPSPDHGWAVGHDGVVLSSSDGGQSWQRRLDGHKAWQSAVSYYEGRVAHGDEAAAHQLNYLKKVAAQAPAWPFLDVWFRNASDGYLVGAFGLILHTTDAGNSWTPMMDLTDNPKRLHLYAVRGHGDDVFIAGEQGLVLRLDVATGRFAALSLPYKGPFFGVAVQATRVVVYGLSGHVLLSDDRGATWRALDTGTAQSFVGYAIQPGGALLLVTQGGKIMRLAPNATQLSASGHAIAGEAFGIAPAGDDGVVVATSTGPKPVRLGGAP
ncbi:Ycf48-like protein [Paraburkholderia saeva]|nr:Ycf48-like protein [Paraburkholderia saeva]